jgi:cytoskeletal protein CcmA (bactofilin family)
LKTSGILDNTSIITTGPLQGGSLTVSGNVNLSGTNTIAGYVTTSNASELYAPLSNPTFIGTPSVPTPELGDNTTKIASTAFVVNAINDGVTLSNGTLENPKTFTGYNQFNSLKTSGISDNMNITTSGSLQGESLHVSDNTIINGNVTTTPQTEIYTYSILHLMYYISIAFYTCYFIPVI